MASFLTIYFELLIIGLVHSVIMISRLPIISGMVTAFGVSDACVCVCMHLHVCECICRSVNVFCLCTYMCSSLC